MKHFRVYHHATRGTEAVKIGFSWPCMCFGVIWLLVKKLWAEAAIVACLGVASFLADVMTAQPGQPNPIGLFLTVVFLIGWLVFAAKANEYREKLLQQRQYELLGQFMTNTPEDAVSVALGQAKAALEAREGILAR